MNYMLGVDPATVYIGGLTPNISLSELTAAFSTFGLWLPPPINHLDRGYIKITYEDPADAKEAIENMNNSVFAGCVLHVNYSTH